MPDIPEILLSAILRACNIPVANLMPLRGLVVPQNPR